MDKSSREEEPQMQARTEQATVQTTDDLPSQKSDGRKQDEKVHEQFKEQIAKTSIVEVTVENTISKTEDTTEIPMVHHFYTSERIADTLQNDDKNSARQKSSNSTTTKSRDIQGHHLSTVAHECKEAYYKTDELQANQKKITELKTMDTIVEEEEQSENRPIETMSETVQDLQRFPKFLKLPLCHQVKIQNINH